MVKWIYFKEKARTVIAYLSGAMEFASDEGAGWSVAMATASSERGLNLRAPGRFLAAANRLVELYKETHVLQVLAFAEKRKLEGGYGYDCRRHQHPS